MNSRREASADILVIGGSFGGVAAALTAASLGQRVILTEETDWLGGQATAQGVPLDEHPWIEQYGSSQSYREFRRMIREYYRHFYPLCPAAARDPFLNPGAAWVSGLAFEPRVGLAVLEQLLAPHRSAGRLKTLMRCRPVRAEVDGDRIVAVTVLDLLRNEEIVLTAPLILDATELGELLELAGVEHVIGSEAMAVTGEPSALDGAAEPLRQQGFTHLLAVDYRPGEDHTIAKPDSYAAWRPGFTGLGGIGTGMRNLFAPSMRAAEGTPDRTPHYEQCIWNFRRVLCRDNFVPGAFASDITMLMCGNEYKNGALTGVTPDEAEKHRRNARELSLSLLYFLQTEIEPGYRGQPGFPGLRPRGDVFGTNDGLAPYPYIREARRIVAETTILEQHFRRDVPGNENGPKLFPDSVGVGGYRIDLHEKAKSSNESVTVALHGTSWQQQIPLGALLPVRMENLLPAAKNIGTTHITNGCFRLHCTEWNIGEAAGALAAFCLNTKKLPRQVRHEATVLVDYQRLLRRLGIDLEWPNYTFGRSYASHAFHEPGWYGGEAWRLDRR